MHISSPIPGKRTRIEIIPLIDIMFFLLAAFMLVSLSMTKVENVPVDLPPAIAAQSEFGPDLLHIAVDTAGKIWVEKKPVTPAELATLLAKRTRVNPQLPVCIGGDTATRHGDMVGVLDLVRQAGIQKVAFTVVAQRP